METQEPATKKLTCIITGRSVFIVKDYYTKKILKAGSEEKLIQTYCCRDAKELLLKGHSVEDIRKILGSKLTNTIPQETLDIIITSKLKNRILSTPQLPLHYETEPEVKAFLETLKNDKSEPGITV